MAAEHLKELVRDLHPDVSVRQLTAAAGVDNGRLAHYLKPGYVVRQVPEVGVCKEIARVLGCDLVDVVEAFAADGGYPWGDTDPAWRRLRRAWRRLAALARARLVTAAERVADGEPLPDEDDDALRRLRRVWANLDEADRATLARVADSLNGGPG